MSHYKDDYDEGDDISEDGEIRSRAVKIKAKRHVDEGSDVSDTQDSLDIRPPQSIPSKEHMKRSRTDRSRYGDKTSGGRRQRKDSHRKGHHRQREHRRTERSSRDGSKRQHRERREERSSQSGSRREERPPPALMSLPTPQIEDLRGHLERKSEKSRSDKDKEHHRERSRVEPEVRKPPPETPQQREERLEKERRMERILNAERERERQKEISRKEMEMRKTRREKEEEPAVDKEQIQRKKPKLEEEKEFEEVTVESDSEEESQEDGEEQSEDSSSDGQEEESSKEESSNESDSESGSSSDSSDSNDEEESENAEVEESKVEKKVSDKSEEEDKNDDTAYVNTPPHSDVEMVEEEEVDPLDKLPPYLPAIQGCRNVEEFQCLNRIEEGTYGVVYRARDKRTEEIVALKRLKMEKEKEGFPITSLREINTLLKAQHPNIVTVREIVVGSNMDKIFIVMDYVEHDLKSLMETMKQKKQFFMPGEIKCLMQQLLRAVAHLHDNWILHRDLKTSNLLLSHRGILKVGDFGLAREYGSPLKAYTPIVVTLWYRAPELLLGVKEYSTPIDVWSVGCIFAELLLMEALFPGKSEIDQLNKIFKALGTPNEKIWPGYKKLPNVQKMTFAEYPISHLRTRFATSLTEYGFDLMNSFLTFDPAKRITAEAAIKHKYFDETPCAIDPAMFPTWPAKSEMGHKKAASSPKPPSGGREYKQLGDGEDDITVAGRSLFEARKTVVGAGFALRF
ncbi:cyclin-dependent kinase 11B [Neocloeon triangulifer]|uniref:cyclin-dependent kinase 11B n=1 Tax=Neocloeon triangulifer TaxID=2078957 RepID=UPI00286F39FF|nr:cyclin-dependent kinase 11B [Neocloeon triangulifer]